MLMMYLQAERSMEDHCPPVKRRRVLHEHHTENSESNKDSNASTNVFPNDGKESLIKGSQIDHFDPEQESIEVKNEIIMEESELCMSTESKMDAIDSLTNVDESKQSGSEVKIEDNLSTKISESCGHHNGHSNSRKKLLVLDVNGLLVDIVLYPDQSYKADTFIGAKAG